MTKNELKEKFETIYGPKEDLLYYFSPGRINLIGEHIDYNGGEVFPTAISLGTYGVLRKRNDSILRLYSENFPEVGIVAFKMEKGLIKDHLWTDYVKGVVTDLLKRKMQLTTGFDLYIVGNLPNGASLSSSASLELLVGHLMRDINNLSLDDLELVKVGQNAENDFVGLHCGIMDQFAIGMSKKNEAILLDCKTLEYHYAPLDLKDNVILIMNTNKRRDLVDSKYNERCKECEKGLKIIRKSYKKVDYLCDLEIEDLLPIQNLIKDKNVYHRVYHAVTEENRVKKTYQALADGNIIAVGRYLNESHASLRDFYEVTGKELDTIVALAQKEEGVLGARMIGAGFAGCAIAIVKKDKVSLVMANVLEGYKKEIGYEPSFYIAETHARTGIMEE